MHPWFVFVAGPWLGAMTDGRFVIAGDALRAFRVWFKPTAV